MAVDPSKRKPLWYHGGLASGMAVVFTHPLDLLKVHLQTQTTGNMRGMQMGLNIIKNHGFMSLYNGLSASIGRQMTYSLTRFAIYDTLRPYLTEKGKDPTFVQKLMLASAGGFFGGIVGTPCDMVNVRMQNDVKLPKEMRRNYKHVFDGLYQVGRKEGVSVLMNGWQMATLRAVLITNGQIAAYDQIKELLLKTGIFEDDIYLHFTTSLAAGAIATGITQPVDVLKTRMMNAKKGEYKNALHCFTETLKQGPTAFFKGFVPAFVRLGPQTVLIWLFKEQLRIRFGTDPS